STDDGAVLMATGILSGAGRIVKAGNGALVLGADNADWTGGMTIDAGLLAVASARAMGSGDVALEGGALLISVNLKSGQTMGFAGNTTLYNNANTTTTLTGNIASLGPLSDGCFIKSGYGTLNLTGNAALGNGVCLQQGTLRVNGIVDSKFLAIGSAAQLRGSGVVNAPVTVHGKLAPGNSAGTLTSSATVTMTGGSTFQADINGLGSGNGAGNYARLQVTGAGQQFIAGGATLEPNLVNIGADAMPYVPALGDGFRIVTAQGGIVGRFAPLDQPAGLAAGSRLALFYNGDASHSIDLRVVPASYAGHVGRRSANLNARAAARVLDAILDADQAGAATATQSALAYSVSALAADRVVAATTRLSGEVHAALAAQAPGAAVALQAAVARQLGGASVSTPAAPTRLWVDLAGNRARWRGDGTVSGFTANRTQLTIGVDPLRTAATRVGGGIAHSSARLSAPDGSGSVDENLLFAYAEHGFAHIVFDTVAAAGRSAWDSQRGEAANHGARGNSTMLSAGLRAAVGIVDAPGTATMQPYARVTWQRNSRDGYNEGSSSPAALTLLPYRASGVRLIAGVSASLAAASGAFQYDIALGRDGGDLVRPVVDAALAGIGMRIAAPQVGRTFVRVHVEAAKAVSRQAVTYFGLAGEFRHGKSDLGVTGGLRVSF
ncbi:MAG: fibronectin-binding autotransporter adhesin, partial [Janthinobacterium sp.]